MMQYKSIYNVFVYAVLCDITVITRKHKVNSESKDSEAFISNVKGHYNVPNNSLTVIKSELAKYYGLVTAEAPSKLPRGPYFGFLTNICNALMSPKFKVKYLGKYISILSKSLQGLGINYLQKIWIKRFRKRLKNYSIYNSKTIKTKVNDFLQFISEEKPKKIAYIEAMNAIYTVVDDMKMDDYVYLLKMYGKGKARHIGDNTRQVFKRIVFGRYHQQPKDVQRDIELKFKSATVEYWEKGLNGTGFNFTLGHLFKFTLSQP